MEFDELAKALASAAMTMEFQLSLGVKEFAREVEQEAKSELGVYQQAVGPFNAWDALADGTKADRARRGFPEDQPLLRSGELRDSIQHEVMGLAAIIGTKSEIGFWQEVGTSTIPPRPFIGPAYVKKVDFLGEEIGRCLMRGFRKI
ncbi:hypothetical protein [Serratia marcescens]|uniref:hypothetical protein n=1 Tax=Serratia marcescens TaxID=615 RepID=UPI0034E8D0CC